MADCFADAIEAEHVRRQPLMQELFSSLRAGLQVEPFAGLGRRQHNGPEIMDIAHAAGCVVSDHAEVISVAWLLLSLRRLSNCRVASLGASLDAVELLTKFRSMSKRPILPLGCTLIDFPVTQIDTQL